MAEPINKCSKCQTQLPDNWYTNEKHGNVCKNCLEELDKQGELWDNFFTIMNFGRERMETGKKCFHCLKTMLDRQTHQKDGNKLTVKHNCQAECNTATQGCGKNFEFTQAYADWITEHNKGNFGISNCPECEIKSLKRLGLDTTEKGKKSLQALEKLIGKGNDGEREREREQNWGKRLLI